MTRSTVPRDQLLASPDIVARALLGAVIERTWQGILLSGRVVETEAYFGVDDPAAHAASGRTPRNAVLFGTPGHAYVYNIYGMHACLNVACEPEGQAGCVLIRALEPVEGLQTMAELRDLPIGSPPRLLTSGPGRLCRALAITRSACNGVDLLDPGSMLRLVRPAGECALPQVLVTPRIGIRKAVDRPLRFLLEGNAFVSGPRRGRASTPAAAEP